MILDEIRIYAQSRNDNSIDDNLETAYEYLWSLEVSNRIKSADLVIDRLKGMGFKDTQSIIEYCIENDTSNIIGWTGRQGTNKN